LWALVDIALTSKGPAADEPMVEATAAEGERRVVQRMRLENAAH